MTIDESKSRESDARTNPAPIPIRVGDRIRVHQQIPQRDDAWITRLEGTVVSLEQSKTGSWFAHSKGDRFWLDRIEIREDDGEITNCNLDQFSRVEIVTSASSAERAS
jgi:hypothetical protein